MPNHGNRTLRAQLPLSCLRGGKRMEWLGFVVLIARVESNAYVLPAGLGFHFTGDLTAVLVRAAWHHAHLATRADDQRNVRKAADLEPAIFLRTPAIMAVSAQMRQLVA